LVPEGPAILKIVDCVLCLAREVRGFQRVRIPVADDNELHQEPGATSSDQNVQGGVSRSADPPWHSLRRTLLVGLISRPSRDLSRFVLCSPALKRRASFEGPIRDQPSPNTEWRTNQPLFVRTLQYPPIAVWYQFAVGWFTSLTRDTTCCRKAPQVGLPSLIWPP
jgi:hypothetical protein